MGCFLTAVPITFNADAYTGVQFYAKGTATALKMIVQAGATEATTYGGRCTLPTLSCAGNEAPVGTLSATDWRLVQIPFSSLNERHRGVQPHRHLEHRVPAGRRRVRLLDRRSELLLTLYGGGVMDSRLVDLEIRYTHLERQYAELSQVVFAQQKIIEGLQRDLDAVRRQLTDLGQDFPNDKPPHY